MRCQGEEGSTRMNVVLDKFSPSLLSLIQLYSWSVHIDIRVDLICCTDVPVV